MKRAKNYFRNYLFFHIRGDDEGFSQNALLGARKSKLSGEDPQRRANILLDGQKID